MTNSPISTPLGTPSERSASLRKFLSALNPTIFVTFEFGGTIGFQQAKGYLKSFMFQAEKKSVGPKFYKKPLSKRVSGVVVVEKIETNLHFHGLLKASPKQTSKFISLSNRIWEETVKVGSIDVSSLLCAEGRRKTSSYCTKELFKHENYENFFFLDDFCPAFYS